MVRDTHDRRTMCLSFSESIRFIKKYQNENLYVVVPHRVV